ncbi:uncharacterized protein LOC116930192 isoform X2 [Daphnia magna]|uniref:uncharacterized protein LOC116930192 isoform X2 n=1 Tax=Daphnia magna TaxID=35525 RepID=UPI001E1BDD4E|nr:uncharacterized protein LOC116930192 isoform X2 [Daphnia magna]
MSNKSSPRRRSVANKRYDEDYEYYVPAVRSYSKTTKSESTADESEITDSQEVKKKRGRPPGAKNKATPEIEAKRGPGRPRRYTAPVSRKEEESSEIKPIEVNILSIQSEEMAESEDTNTEPPKKEKVNLGQVLELAVQSMSVTMETEEEEEVEQKETSKHADIQISQEDLEVHQKITFESTKDHDSDFEWKLENEEEPVSHSPPAKKKKITASNSFIVPTNADDLEEFEEDGEGRIQVRTIVVGEGEGARIECLSCHRIMKPGSLKAHLKTHAHERPHACDLCDARFTRRGDLERHIKVVHNKDRPFKCSKCHRTFGDKKNLRWHLSNHDRKLFHHCQVCGFKFGKREYWENHVRYIHPIPGTELEPVPAEMPEVESKDGPSTSGSMETGQKKVDPVVVNKMLNGNKGTPALVYTKRGAVSNRLSTDPFAGLKTPKVVFPPTYWDNWDEFMERTQIWRFRPSIQRFGSSGRPLRRKKVPETVVELRPSERPDSQFDIGPFSAEETLLDDQTGAFVTSTGEVVGYPEEMFKLDENAENEEEEEEEEEEDNEPVRIDVGEIQLEQPMSGTEVLSTHHLVYGEDGQMRLMVGPGRVDGEHDLVEGGVYDDDEDGMLRGDLGHAFVESGQIVILQPDGSAVLAPAGGQLVETENGQLILVQTHEDGTQTAVAYATAQTMDDTEAVEEDESGEIKNEPASNQDAVQTLIDAVQELIDNRQKPS